MHRKYPFVGGLALGLVLLAAAASAVEYSGATLPGLPSLAYGNSALNGKVKTVENEGASAIDDAAAEEARKRLKNELDRMRQGTRHEKAELQAWLATAREEERANGGGCRCAPPAAAETTCPGR